MTVETIMELLYGDKKNYRGTALMKFLLENNEEFKKIIEEGIMRGKIDRIWDQIFEDNNNLNLDSGKFLIEQFETGYNIGNCLNASKVLSYSLPDDCEIAGGTNDYLIGTRNSEDGKHTWVVWNYEILDTTFMITIDVEYAKKLGYKQENIYRPMDDKNYAERKKFLHDETIKTK